MAKLHPYFKEIHDKKVAAKNAEIAAAKAAAEAAAEAADLALVIAQTEAEIKAEEFVAELVSELVSQDAVANFSDYVVIDNSLLNITSVENDTLVNKTALVEYEAPKEVSISDSVANAVDYAVSSAVDAVSSAFSAASSFLPSFMQGSSSNAAVAGEVSNAVVETEL